MKKKVIISILIIIVLALVGIGIYFGAGLYSYYKNGEEDVIKIDVDPIPKETETVEENKEEVIDENITEDNDDTNENTESNDNSSDSNVTTTSESNKKSSTNDSSNKSVTNNNKTSDTNANKENNSITNTTTETIATTTEETGPWTNYGMTKDEYYNKPLYSWERVDYSIDKYGSESSTRQACLNYGDNYEPYLNGEVSYSCSIVRSASGKYLGEMFSTEKLN